MDMVYSSIENKKIKDIKKLNQKKYQIDNFIVEGEHLVNEAYKKGLLKTLIVEETSDFSLDVETLYVTENVLKYISELDNPQKIMGICKKIIPNENLGNKILILDKVQDPGNLGTIIRSAVAFNVDTIILSEDTVSIYNSKVIRASQGMLFHINIKIGNLKEEIDNLKRQNYKIYSTDVNNGKSLKSLEKIDKFAIIMGNEGNGVSDEINKLSDEYIYINMNENCESLNVAIAASIILYELDK